MIEYPDSASNVNNVYLKQKYEFKLLGQEIYHCLSGCLRNEKWTKHKVTVGVSGECDKAWDLPLRIELLSIAVRGVARYLAGPQSATHHQIGTAHDQQRQKVDKHNHADMVPVSKQERKTGKGVREEERMREESSEYTWIKKLCIYYNSVLLSCIHNGVPNVLAANLHFCYCLVEANPCKCPHFTYWGFWCANWVSDLLKTAFIIVNGLQLSLIYEHTLLWRCRGRKYACSHAQEHNLINRLLQITVLNFSTGGETRVCE